MLYNYEEALKLYVSDYQLKKAILNKQIYKVEKGIYSDKKNNFDIYELVLKKYPSSFLVKESAFYYLGFLKEEPEKIHLGTNRNSLRIKDKRIQQHFYSDFDKEYIKDYGIEQILSYKNVMSYVTENQNEIRLLNLNALLYDLVRNRKNISEKEFQEIIENYKKCKYFRDFSTMDFDDNFILRKEGDYDYDLIDELKEISFDNQSEYSWKKFWNSL